MPIADVVEVVKCGRPIGSAVLTVANARFTAATEATTLFIPAAATPAPRAPTSWRPGRVQIDDQHLILTVALVAEPAGIVVLADIAGRR